MTVLAKLRARAGLNDTPQPPKPLPAHGTFVVMNGRPCGWMAPENWHPQMARDDAHPVTRMRLAGMFWHEGA